MTSISQQDSVLDDPRTQEMRVVLLGAPGAGIGTQGRRIARRYGITFISSGDLLRAQISRNSTWGCQARPYVDAGRSVPDTIVNSIVRQRLSEPDCAHGFVLDGYPRTQRQLTTLDMVLAESHEAISTVLGLHLAPDLLIQRRLERANRLGRTNESEDVVKEKRLAYAEQTVPLLAAYDSRAVLVWIDGSGTVDEVAARIQGALEPYGSSIPQQPLITWRN